MLEKGGEEEEEDGGGGGELAERQWRSHAWEGGRKRRREGRREGEYLGSGGGNEDSGAAVGSKTEHVPGELGDMPRPDLASREGRREGGKEGGKGGE